MEAALGALGLRPDSRAQDLDVDQFVALHWELHKLQAAGGGGGGKADPAAAGMAAGAAEA